MTALGGVSDGSRPKGASCTNIPLNDTNSTRKAAIKFIVFMGVVSLFADMTHEGARSITGPYLAFLGASATVVGFVAGFGELVGYAFRFVSGYFGDRTGMYWGITILGYVINMVAVPLLALVGRWETAAALIIAERMGRAIRNPVRDAMLSHATSEVGRGLGFGFHEAMDQIGAMIGLLIVAGVLYFNGTYQSAFTVLWIPAILTIGVLIAARVLYPNPRDLESTLPELETKGLSRVYWIYLAAMAVNAAGYADHPLIAYHFQHAPTVSPDWIPVFYAIAMGVDAIAALIFGRLFNVTGIPLLIFICHHCCVLRPSRFPWRVLCQPYWRCLVGDRHGRTGIHHARGNRRDGFCGQARHGLWRLQNGVRHLLVCGERPHGFSLRLLCCLSHRILIDNPAEFRASAASHWKKVRIQLTVSGGC